jgi:hypothetical protein
VNDLSKATIKGLARKGIALVGLQAIPGPYGGSTGYILNDNGTRIVRCLVDVRKLAGTWPT